MSCAEYVGDVMPLYITAGTIILIEDIPEIGKVKGDKAEFIQNVKSSYLVRFEDGKEEWILPHVFTFEELS